MVLVMATRTSGCGGIQAPQRIEQDGELYHKQETRSEGLPSRLHLDGWLLR